MVSQHRNWGNEKWDRQKDKRSFRKVLVSNLDNKSGETKNEQGDHGMCSGGDVMNEVKESMRIVNGKVDQRMLERLEKSLIGESTTPILVDDLTEKLIRVWSSVVKISNMGSKALITFDTKKDLEEALSSGRNMLLKHFDVV